MDQLENEVPIQAPEHTETPPAEPVAEVAAQPETAEAEAPQPEAAVPQAEAVQQPVPVQPMMQQPGQPYYQSPVYFTRPTQVAQSPYANSPYVMSRQPMPGGYYTGYGFVPAAQVVYPVPPVQAQPVPPAAPAQMPPAPPVPPVQTPPVQHKPPVQTPPTPPKPPVKPEGSPEPEKAKPPKKRGKGRAILAAILVLVLVAGSCGVTAALVNLHWEKETAQMNQTLEQKINALQTQLNTPENVTKGESISGTPNSTTDGSLTPAQVFAQNQKSVVLIYNEVSGGYYGGASSSVYTGSGFILTEDGYVVTNYHVVEGGKLSFVTHDGMEYAAVLVGYDENNDVALLKAEVTGLQAVTLGSSDDLIVGDQVVAIGNPLGELTSTLTVGYVSAMERDITTEGTTINMIQTDAAINSGNSGGPLFNMHGEVVGITTAKYSGTSSSGASIEGIGFAIPIDDVQDIFEDLMTYGYVTSGYLGVSVYSVDVETAAMYNFPLGCLVESVTPGSCAAKAGVQAKDIIIGLGEYKVEGYTDLARALRKFEGGDTTTVTVYRSGRELKLDITLDEKPIEQTVQIPGEKSDMPENGTYEDWYKYFFGNK
ncbi:MAG: trypsin-like peptidase domain-containing protein [Oscillospiraceae bacterium]|nr:trypsin-like peptidase domain-containing protein [Oscillospiraceae bacterium]